MCCGAEPRPLVNPLGSFGTQVCRRSVSGTGNKSCARRAVGLRDGPAVAADAGGDVTTKALAARREESTISAMCRTMQLTIFSNEGPRRATPRVSRRTLQRAARCCAISASDGSHLLATEAATAAEAAATTAEAAAPAAEAAAAAAAATEPASATAEVAAKAHRRLYELQRGMEL